MVRLVRSPKDGRPEDESLGTALVDPATGTGVLATVYVDRVERLARGSNGDLGTLLGRAMAHEIGHLLMGRAAHAVRGLMRPRWTRAEVARNVKAGLGPSTCRRPAGHSRPPRALLRRPRAIGRAADGERRLHPRRRERNLAQARAGGVEDGVADRGRHGGDGGFAGAVGRADGWGTSTASTAGVRVPTANVR